MRLSAPRGPKVPARNAPVSVLALRAVVAVVAATGGGGSGRDHRSEVRDEEPEERAEEPDRSADRPVRQEPRGRPGVRLRGGRNRSHLSFPDGMRPPDTS